MGSCSGSKTGKTIRFGISADERLLEKFDGMIAEMGYATRSEAMRDLIRDQLVEFTWTKDDADVVGTITIVYNREPKELTKKLTELKHQNHTHIISSLHVHLDGDNCLEVLLIKGKSKRVKSISDRFIGIKGIKHGKLIMSTTGKELY
jgi:CopG family nickel-responsive transcriptional regulator